MQHTPGFHDTAISPSLHREGGEQEKVQGKEVDFDENNDNWSEHGDKILVDNVTGREDEMEEEIGEMNDSDAIREMCMSLLADFQSMKESLACLDKYEPIKDTANEFETESETENETETSPTREDEQPVRAVRVPAHQITDRKFVKVERKRRKRKDHQKDCKTS